MPRTVVPPALFRGPGGVERVGGDSLPERLAKYVPAETLAFFVPAATILADRRSWLVVIVVVGVIGTAGYLWLSRTQAEADERPLPHFYVLACIAFLCWAVGTSAALAALIGFDHVEAGAVLGIAVFVIPLLDELLNRILVR